MQKKVAIHTLGCKVNQNESEAIAADFSEGGYEIVGFNEQADIYIVNTCTVTHLGDKKSRQMLRRAIAKNSEAIIVATGCYAQTNPEELEALNGIDLIVGNKEKGLIYSLTEDFYKKRKRIKLVGNQDEHCGYTELNSSRITQRSRAYLKIQEGCEQFCSYCIIPYARGPLRSQSARKLLREAKELAEKGFAELILTGIHVGNYGKDLPDGPDLYGLIKRILAETDIARVRLSSIEPTEVVPELISLAANDKRFCPHFHIPLQYGSDRVLKAMNRPYTTEMYRELIRRLRFELPEIALTTDFMVGFPGENEKDFHESREFIAEMSFSGMHVFKYSPRDGTPAALMPDRVTGKIADERSRIVRLDAEKMAKEYAARFLGAIRPVLLEEKTKDGHWRGHTDNYLEVTVVGKGKKGEIRPVLLEKTMNGKMSGRVVE